MLPYRADVRVPLATMATPAPPPHTEKETRLRVGEPGVRTIPGTDDVSKNRMNLRKPRVNMRRQPAGSPCVSMTARPQTNLPRLWPVRVCAWVKEIQTNSDVCRVHYD